MAASRKHSRRRSFERTRASQVRRPRPRPGTPGAPPRSGWTALTGTPGTGKTTLANYLDGSDILEVRDLAIRLGAGHRVGRAQVEVDVGKLRAAFRRYQRSHPAGVVVGHLAHLLSVQYVVLLRCHPRELERRLRRAHRQASSVAENVLAEALDVVLIEALRRRLPVYEVDTTGTSPTEAARRVQRLLTRAPRSRYGRIRWLSDPAVTAQLLRRRA